MPYPNTNAEIERSGVKTIRLGLENLDVVVSREASTISRMARGNLRSLMRWVSGVNNVIVAENHSAVIPMDGFNISVRGTLRQPYDTGVDAGKTFVHLTVTQEGDPNNFRNMSASIQMVGYTCPNNPQRVPVDALYML